MSAYSRTNRSSQFNSTSLGTSLCERGSFFPTPEDNYLSGNGLSYVYTGPSYYIPSERRWISVNDYQSLPLSTRRDAILFESEEEWRKFQERRVTMTDFSGIPAMYPTSHTTVLLPHQQTAWSRRWDGSGFFVPSGNAWMHEQVGPNIPTESLLFYNEEDWMKFKYMSENPSLPDVKEGTFTI